MIDFIRHISAVEWLALSALYAATVFAIICIVRTNRYEDDEQ